MNFSVFKDLDDIKEKMKLNDQELFVFLRDELIKRGVLEAKT